LSHFEPKSEAEIMNTPRIKRQLRAAFIATVGAVAMTLATGCENPGETTNNPPTPGGCPENGVSNGDPCAEIGRTCDYGDYSGDDFCSDTTAECTSEGWVTETSTSCNPPSINDCPSTAPQVGNTCTDGPGLFDYAPSGCNYAFETPCGWQEAVMSCVYEEDGSIQWAFDFGEAPSCELPPELCNSYGDVALCGADPGCQWLVPGCASEEETTIDVGCYPASDCSETGCGDWGSCVTGVHDPCYGSQCEACGAELSVCVADASM
jgi:hypothetical protein